MADENELDLYKKWKQTGDKQAFQDLYRSMKPLIYTAAKKASYGSNIPESAHKIYAAQNFFDSLRTYDPSKRQLKSHVYEWVEQKAKRLNYQYQNLGHIPEPRAQSVGLYQTIYSNLRDELGREPSQAELADRLQWGLKDVANIQKEIRKDLAIMEGTQEVPIVQSRRDEEMLDYLYYELPPEEQVVYEYIFGKHGKQAMIKPGGKVDYDRIASQVGFSVSKVRSLAANIGKKFERESRR